MYIQCINTYDFYLTSMLFQYLEVDLTFYFKLSSIFTPFTSFTSFIFFNHSYTNLFSLVLTMSRLWRNQLLSKYLPCFIEFWTECQALQGRRKVLCIFGSLNPWSVLSIIWRHLLLTIRNYRQFRYEIG